MLRKKKIRTADRLLFDACDALNILAVRAAIAAGADVNAADQETQMAPIDIVAGFAPETGRSMQFRLLAAQILALLLVHGAAPDGGLQKTDETPLALFRRYDPEGPCCRMLLAAANRPARHPEAMVQERL